MTDLAPSEAQADPETETGAPALRPGRIRRAWDFVTSLFTLRVDKSRARVALVAFAFAGLFAIIGGQLAMIAFSPDERSALPRATGNAIAAQRPDIIDRTREVMATDVHVVTVFADPRKVVDKDEGVELMT